jgi:pantoate--beta-alanine ligase
METLNRIQAVRGRVREWRAAGLRVGFVPTMGNLHRGHLSLVEAALGRADRVVASVFVNPLQFGPTEDFGRYPRTLERDSEQLEQAGTHLLFAPDAHEMYPAGAGHSSIVDVPEFAAVLEGQFRPGHFAGVATVVTKLFNIVAPDVALFGEKDFQQLVVVRRLVRDLCMPVEVVGVPTVRDPDGLALSSRNQYLSPQERAVAPRLHATLGAVRERVLAGGRRWADIEAQALRELSGAGFEPDYVSVRRAADLLPPRGDEPDLVVLAAARLGSTRLIDNLRIDLTPVA